MRLRQCQVIGTWVWRFRIDYLRLGRRALAEVEGRRIRLQVVLAEGGLSLAAVEAEDRRTDWESDGRRWIVPSFPAGS